MKKVYIRADMNQKIATGHVMRCLSIADGLKEKGIQSVFISADDNSKELVNSRGYELIVLDTNWDNMEEEIPILRSIIKANRIEKLIIDSYYATKRYLEEITRLTNTIYIDDLNRRDLCVDTIIAYTIYADENKYKSIYKQKQTGLLIGAKYVPLREEFHNISKRKINKSIENVLVLSGGADPYNIIEKCIDILIEEGVSSINGICGKYAEHKDRLQQKYKKYKNIKIIDNATNIKELMLEADFCVSASGSTLYELCACGTPTVSYVLADNQVNNAERFSEKQIIPCLGDVRKIVIDDELIRQLKELNDYNYRKELSEKMQLVVDGRGAERIAGFIRG